MPSKLKTTSTFGLVFLIKTSILFFFSFLFSFLLFFLFGSYFFSISYFPLYPFTSPPSPLALVVVVTLLHLHTHRLYPAMQRRRPPPPCLAPSRRAAVIWPPTSTTPHCHGLPVVCLHRTCHHLRPPLRVAKSPMGTEPRSDPSRIWRGQGMFLPRGQWSVAPKFKWGKDQGGKFNPWRLVVTRNKNKIVCSPHLHAAQDSPT